MWELFLPGHCRRALLRPLAVALCLATAVPAGATAARAQSSSSDVLSKLETTAERLHAAEEQEAELSDEVDALQRKIDASAEERAAVQLLVAAYARSAYKTGGDKDPIVTLITGTRSDNALDKITMLDQAGRHARETIQRAAALNRELRVSQEAIATKQARLAVVRAGLAGDSAELEQLFSVVSTREAAKAVQRAAEAERLRKERLANERAKRERARERALAERRRRASRSVRALTADEPGDDSDSPENDDPEPAEPDDSPEVSSAGTACAVGPAHTFRDTWGDRRSGGRRHKGTDIFAPHGSPIYAVTDGVIAGTRSGGLGGKSIILRGDNGDSYYYAHNSSHSVGPGERVRAGERIGSVGATGNAAGGAAHVHFERWPGGGRPTNPYGFLRRACG